MYIYFNWIYIFNFYKISSSHSTLSFKISVHDHLDQLVQVVDGLHVQSLGVVAHFVPDLGEGDIDHVEDPLHARLVERFVVILNLLECGINRLRDIKLGEHWLPLPIMSPQHRDTPDMQLEYDYCDDF